MHCPACQTDKDEGGFYSIETKVNNKIINSYVYDAACKECISENDIKLVRSVKRPDLRIGASYNKKVKEALGREGYTFEWNAVQVLFFDKYNDVQLLNESYKENKEQFTKRIKFYIELGLLESSSFILSNSRYNKLSKTFSEQTFYKTEGLKTLAALIKGKKFLKRSSCIEDKIKTYNINQCTENKNVFFHPSGELYLLIPLDQTQDRTCSTCLHVRSSEEFSKTKGTHQCLYCSQKMCRESYQNLPEDRKKEHRANVRKNRKNNRDRYRGYRRMSGRRFNFSESYRLPINKTSKWLNNEYYLKFFYNHPSGVKMINAGSAGDRVQGGRGPGYETKMFFDEELGNQREHPIYNEQDEIKAQMHWQIDHSIPSSLINKACLKFNFNSRKVYASHYLNLRPMWYDENLSKADSIAGHVLEDEEFFEELVKEIFIEVAQEENLNKIINYLKKLGGLNENIQLTFL